MRLLNFVCDFSRHLTFRAGRAIVAFAVLIWLLVSTAIVVLVFEMLAICSSVRTLVRAVPFMSDRISGWLALSTGWGLAIGLT